jgi:hypothetical protein
MPKGITKKLTNLAVLPSPPERPQSSLSNLSFANPESLFLRDGESSLKLDMLSPGATLVGLVMKYRHPTMSNISAQQNTSLAVSRCRLIVVICIKYEHHFIRDKFSISVSNRST